MFTAQQEVEFSIMLPAHKMGTVDILSQLRSAHIQIRTCTYCQEPTGQMARLIADDPAHTLDVLEKAGHQYKSQAVILVEIKPYNPAVMIKLHDTLERAGVSILSSHLCSCDADVISIAVLTTDNAVAFHAIQEAQHEKPDALSA